MNNTSPAKRKLLNYLRKKDPNLTDKESIALLNDFVRFVNVVQKIYTEPQAVVTIKEKIIDGKTIKQRVFAADLEELKKVYDKKKSPQDLLSLVRKFHKSVTKDKYDR